jgi:hypothetical protein
LGGVSTVELRVGLEPAREGTVTDAGGESGTEYSGSDGTTVVGGVAGTSEVTVGPDPQFEHGAAARTGVV